MIQEVILLEFNELPVDTNRINIIRRSIVSILNRICLKDSCIINNSRGMNRCYSTTFINDGATRTRLRGTNTTLSTINVSIVLDQITNLISIASSPDQRRILPNITPVTDYDLLKFRIQIFSTKSDLLIGRTCLNTARSKSLNNSLNESINCLSYVDTISCTILGRRPIIITISNIFISVSGSQSKSRNIIFRTLCTITNILQKIVDRLLRKETNILNCLNSGTNLILNKSNLVNRTEVRLGSFNTTEVTTSQKI